MESYKGFQTRVLETVFGKYRDPSIWKADKNNEYCTFMARYDVLKEALDSIQDNPHVWVRNAINDKINSDFKDMEDLIRKGID